MMVTYKYCNGVICDPHYEMSINQRYIISTASSCKSQTKLPTTQIISHYEYYQNNTVSSKYNEGYKNKCCYSVIVHEISRRTAVVHIIIRTRFKKKTSVFVTPKEMFRHFYGKSKLVSKCERLFLYKTPCNQIQTEQPAPISLEIIYQGTT